MNECIYSRTFLRLDRSNEIDLNGFFTLFKKEWLNSSVSKINLLLKSSFGLLESSVCMFIWTVLSGCCPCYAYSVTVLSVPGKCASQTFCINIGDNSFNGTGIPWHMDQNTSSFQTECTKPHVKIHCSIGALSP